MRLKILFLTLALFVVQGCEFASGPGGPGGGTGGDGLTLTGIIQDPQGVPVAGAKVRLYPEEYALAKWALATAVRRDSTVTDSAGRFRFTNLEAGRYNIEASALRGDSLYSVFIPGVYVGENTDLGTKMLTTSGSLEVQVQDVNGHSLSGASCQIVGGPWESMSDQTGYCPIAGLAPGVYQVLVSYPGMRSVVVQNVTVLSGQQTSAGFVTLASQEPGADTTWTARRDVPKESFSQMAWSGGLLVAVGSGVDVYGDGYGLIVTSPDGITWTKQSSGTAKALEAVVWAGDRFVAVGDGGIVLTSANGVGWTQRASLDTTWPFTSIIWSGTKLLAAGWTYTALSSDGGVSWTKYSRDKDFSGIAWSGSIFVAIGSGGRAWSSPDGVTWMVRDPQTTNTLNAVAWADGQFVAVGGNGTIRTSADGITWEKRVSGSTSYLMSIARVSDRWIVDGSLQSSDGILWTPVPYSYGYPAFILSTGARLVGLAGGTISTSP